MFGNECYENASSPLGKAFSPVYPNACIEIKLGIMDKGDQATERTGALLWGQEFAQHLHLRH